MKKFNYTTVSISLFLVISLLFSSCLSSRAERYIASGNPVAAIELMAPKLAKNPTDKKLAPMFAGIYPSTMEDIIPDYTVDQIISKNLDPYNRNQILAIKKCAAEISPDSQLTSHPTISKIIRNSESNLVNLKNAIRIQKAVYIMPKTIGNPKKGQQYSVPKYTNDFSGQLKDDSYSLGMFYYNLGEALYSGKSIRQKKEIIEYYKKAKSYSSDIPSSSTKCAQLCYEIAQEYEKNGTISGKKDAISWYKAAMEWVPGYSNSQNCIYRLNYEIAMELKSTATTKNDYEQVIYYLKLAGNYKDTATQLKEVMYLLAYLYRNDNTISSYEKAGEYFVELGTYKNSANEASLYNFYKKLKTLSKTDRTSSVSLNTGSVTNYFNKKITPIDKNYAYSDIETNTSVLKNFDSVTDETISPGSIITGTSISNLTFKQFSYGDRNPLNFSINYDGYELTNGTINNPGTRKGASAVKNAAARYERKINPETTYNFIPVYSKDDLLASLGLGTDKPKYAADFGNTFWDDNLLLVEVTQKFYTASISAPALPVDFFSTDNNVVSANNVRDVTPYYVSSVDYGRKGYFLISSELSTDELIQDIKEYRPRDSYNKSGSSGRSISRELENKWKKYHTTVNAIAAAEKDYIINSADSMYKWIKIGIDKDLLIQDLVPIHFSLRNLYTNEYAVLSRTDRIKIKYKSPEPEYEPEPEQTQKPEPLPITPDKTEPADKQETPDTPAIGNPLSSLVFVGPTGTVYKCKNITDITYTYEIPESEIQQCVAVWDTAKIRAVTINGVQMTPRSTVYSFRDVAGNTISLDITDAKGNWKHYLLIVKKI